MDQPEKGEVLLDSGIGLPEMKENGRKKLDRWSGGESMRNRVKDKGKGKLMVSSLSITSFYTWNM